jgi:hypothetical protein
MKLSSKNKYTVGEIPTSDKKLFEAIRNPDYNNFALMKIKFNEYETSCIISVNEDPKGIFNLKPLAILVNDDILKHFKILCPDGMRPQ